MLTSRPFTFDRTMRILFSIGLVLVVWWLLVTLANVLLPFSIACLIAYFLEPLCQFNMRLLRTRHRVIPTFLTLFETTVVIVGLIYLFTPSVTREIDQMEQLLKNYSASDTNLDIPFLPHEFTEYFRQWLDLDKLRLLVTQEHLSSLLNRGVSIVSFSLGVVFHTLEWFLMFIYVIFILIDYPRLMKGFRLLVPPKVRPQVYRVEDDIKESMNRYFRVQVLLALCAAVFYCIGFSIVGIPLAIVLGILVGVLYLIPYFQYITLIPVTAVCYIYSLGGEVQFWPIFGQCILVYAVTQTICDYVLTPKIMGKVMGLNPAIILLSLSVWGTLLGLIGMIIAIPMTTLLLSYYQEYVIKPEK